MVCWCVHVLSNPTFSQGIQKVTTYAFNEEETFSVNINSCSLALLRDNGKTIQSVRQ